MTSKFYERLSCDLEKILENSDNYDVVIEVGESPLRQSYNAHLTILRYRCPSLYKELNEISLNGDNIKTIQKPNISAKTFNIIIKLFSATHYSTPIICFFEILPARDLTILELPVREITVPSNVITNEHAAQISSWIDGVTHNVENNPYKFDLLIRGSQDGFEYSTFWEKCSKKNMLVVVLEVEQTGEKLGGYNPIGWEPYVWDGYTQTNGSFIFSLKTENTSHSTISRIKKFQRAINNDYQGQGGPSFGSQDLLLLGNFKTDKRCYCRKSDYVSPIRSEKGLFSVKDYEVFQVRLRTENE
ncbi:15437_t:CDS:2 [Acaulospora morrowiae]|uniref:15437_t:CDS:1 n=1 Tax=Acaulospora morrowiae TaxID=94023 RepID=A0A9N9H7G4_9GLOM|nr:15437_t:CDS:2 [Acaulospora morrowiae]